MTIGPKFPPFDPARIGTGTVPYEEDNVFIFPTESVAEGQETSARLDKLNRTARECGWRQALVETFGASGNVDYVTSEERLGFFPILPLNPDQALLEIGVSLGQIAIPLARQVKTLDGLEVVRGQALFCAERARQEGLTNVRIAAGGQDCRLPYADAGFDGVVLNLVLEWCADRESEDHEKVQQRLLDEIARVLKPGGFFYVQTKNRYALRLLLGGRDEHMFNRRWGNALPRCLARMLDGRRPRGRLHSFNHLSLMLRRAGFHTVDGYWAAPEMRKPQAVVPLRGETLRNWRKTGGIAQGPSRKTALIMSLLPDRFVKYVTPGLTFLALR